MRTRNILPVLVFLLGASSAALAAGDNVVMISVGKVDVPAKLPGFCAVDGVISRVWEGKAYHSGQTISLKVPCRDNGAALIPAVALMGAPTGPRPVAADILKNSRQGLARLDDSGVLIWDYTQRSYGSLGPAGGYKIVDGAALPTRP